MRKIIRNGVGFLLEAAVELAKRCVGSHTHRPVESSFHAMRSNVSDEDQGKPGCAVLIDYQRLSQRVS